MGRGTRLCSVNSYPDDPGLVVSHLSSGQLEEYDLLKGGVGNLRKRSSRFSRYCPSQKKVGVSRLDLGNGNSWPHIVGTKPTSGPPA